MNDCKFDRSDNGSAAGQSPRIHSEEVQIAKHFGGDSAYLNSPHNCAVTAGAQATSYCEKLNREGWVGPVGVNPRLPQFATALLENEARLRQALAQGWPGGGERLHWNGEVEVFGHQQILARLHCKRVEAEEPVGPTADDHQSIQRRLQRFYDRHQLQGKFRNVLKNHDLHSSRPKMAFACSFPRTG